jgi:hypothetical protein
MRMQGQSFPRQFWLALLAVSVATSASAAPIIIAGTTYNSANFATSLMSSSGSFSVGGGAPNLASALTDTTVNTWAFTLDRGGYVQLGFNGISNGPGSDLVFFEIGVPDNFGISLTVGGPITTIASSSTGFTQGQGFGINIASIDLSVLGVAPGGSVSSIVVNMGPAFGAGAAAPTLGAAVGLNAAAVPEPATFGLIGAGLVLSGLLRRMRNRR